MPLQHVLSGSAPVIPDCISFQSIPHTNKIFTDFLSYSPDVRQFYPHIPDAQHVAQFAASVPRHDQRQARVADALERQNRAWGASETTLRNIQRLREGAFAVVTGQQVGLFGGPLYSFLKAAAVITLGRQVERAGVECVPIFWLASEDHDLEEVNQALLLDREFQLVPFSAKTRGIEGAPVANVRLAEGTNELVAKAGEMFGESLAADYLRESYREGETFASAFARLYTRIFGDHGLIFLDPSDPELHSIAAPLFAEAVSRSAELDTALLERNRALTALQYHEQVKITDQSTPLFAVVEGSRVVVHRGNGDFTVGRERLSRDQLLQKIEEHPEQFSANVLLRPVLQDYWLPTLAYIGGPAEVAYFAQVGVVYEKLLGRVTPILPRLSATLIEPRIERLLTKYDLDLTEVFHGECQLRDCLASKTLPGDLKQSFAEGKQIVEQAIGRITESLEKLDKTLVEAAANAASKMQYQIDTLEKRASQAELRRSEVLARHASQIENGLFPHKQLQEREIAALYFYANHGPELIDRLIESAEAPCPEHKIVKLS